MNKILAMNLKINFDIKVKKKQHYRYIFSINHLITTHTCRPCFYLLHQSINKKKNSAMNVKINFDIKRGKKTTICSTNHLNTTNTPCFYPLHWSINDKESKKYR